MSLSDGSATEYKELMFGSIDIYLRKFEHQLKQKSNGKGSNRV